MAAVLCMPGCKTGKKTTVKSSDKVQVAFDDAGTDAERTKPDKSREGSYPAAGYYGDSWNNDHVRYSSSGISAQPVSLLLIPPGTHDFKMPVCGNVLSEFGPRNGRMHTGIDIKLKMNDPVYCAFDGMVRMAKDYSGYGKMVVVRHDNGLETLYAHLNYISVKVNQYIKAGTLIGGGGKTGRASGEHLHFEVRFQSEPFNPRLVVDFDNCRLKTQTITLTESSYKQYYKNLQVASSSEDKKHTEKTVKHTEKTVKAKEHIVEKGDTLYNISRRYGTTVDALRTLNKLTDSDILQIGQKILVSK